MKLSDIVNKIEIENAIKDIDYLRTSKNKIFIYGASETARRKLDLLRKENIKVDGFFVDAEYYKEGESIDGIKVYLIDDVLSENSQFDTVIGFYAYDKYQSVLKDGTLLHKGKVFYLSDGHWWFDKQFFYNNEALFQETYDWLEDSESKDVFIAYLKSRIAMNPKYLVEKYTADQYFDKCIALGSNVTFIDVGAYTGDTIEEFLKHVDNKFYKIYAFEADKNNAEKLIEKYKDYDNIVKIPKGAYSKNTVLRFDANSSTSSKIDNDGDVVLEVVTIDSCINDVSNEIFLKADIEGSELEMLKGAENLIKRYKPKMAICVYHKENDLITIPQYIKSLNSSYKFYLRHHSKSICDETVLYAL